VKHRSEEARQDFGGNGNTKARARFEQTRDVGKILLPFAGWSLWILHCPDFPAKNILDSRDGERESQDVARRCAIYEFEIARIALELNAQIGSGCRDNQIVRELLDLELTAEECLGARKVLNRDREVEIDCHHRFRIRIDS
jgi:hypothetical protein